MLRISVRIPKQKRIIRRSKDTEYFPFLVIFSCFFPRTYGVSLPYKKTYKTKTYFLQLARAEADGVQLAAPRHTTHATRVAVAASARHSRCERLSAER